MGWWRRGRGLAKIAVFCQIQRTDAVLPTRAPALTNSQLRCGMADLFSTSHHDSVNHPEPIVFASRGDKRHPTPDVLRELLDYDPDAGIFIWKRRSAHMFPSSRTARIWNTRYAGKQTFNRLNPSGYHAGAVLEVGLLAHRVAYALHHGRWPLGEIDHINRIKTDTRIVNLRDVSRAQNEMNKPASSRSSTGVRGVYVDRRRGGFNATVHISGKAMHLGRFLDLASAVAAREQAIAAIKDATDAQ